MSSVTPSVEIGPFVVGEVPDPLEYQFLDEDGAPKDLTGYNAKFSYRQTGYSVRFGYLRGWGAATLADADVTTPLQGKVTYTWVGGEFPFPGHYLAELWSGNGTQRYASVLIEWDVRAAVGEVPPL